MRGRRPAPGAVPTRLLFLRSTRNQKCGSYLRIDLERQALTIQPTLFLGVGSTALHVLQRLTKSAEGSLRFPRGRTRAPDAPARYRHQNAEWKHRTARMDLSRMNC